MKKRVPTILLIVLLLAGVSLLLYPTISDYWNSFHVSQAVAVYAQDVEKLDQAQYDQIWRKAKDYNTALLKRPNLISLSEEEKEVYYRELCLNSPEFHLASGLPAFLDRLLEEKIPFTIATASGKKNVRFFFEHLELERWFDPEQVVYNDGTLPGKPEPDLYLKAAGRLAISPEDCIIFEDSLSGIEAAGRAGSRRIIGISSMKSEEELRQAGADEVWKDYEGAEFSK